MRWVALVLGLVVLAGSGYAQQTEYIFSVSYDGTSATFTCDYDPRGHCEIQYVKAYWEACHPTSPHVAKFSDYNVRSGCVYPGESLRTCGVSSYVYRYEKKYENLGFKLSFGKSFSYSYDYTLYGPATSPKAKGATTISCEAGWWADHTKDIQTEKVVFGIRFYCDPGYVVVFDSTGRPYCKEQMCKDYPDEYTCENIMRGKCCWDSVEGVCKRIGECGCSAYTNPSKCVVAGCCWTGDSCVEASQCSGECVDTDGGLSPLTAGTCTDYFQVLSDTCISPTKLKEYFCGQDPWVCRYEIVDCSALGGVCMNGRCTGECKDVGEPCTSSNECCSGYCYGTSPGTYTCQPECAKSNYTTKYYAPDPQACCYGLDGEVCKGAPSTTPSCSDLTTQETCEIYGRNNNCRWCGPPQADCSPNTCGDGIDNDGDGFVDEEDSGCWTGGYVNVGDYDPSRSECRHNYCYSKDQCQYCCGYTCQSQPCEGCNDGVKDTNPNSCAYVPDRTTFNDNRNSCETAETVVVNMTDGTVIKSFIVESGDKKWYDGRWYKVKGAVGKPLNISFYSPLCSAKKLNLYVFATSDCDELLNTCLTPFCWSVAKLTYNPSTNASSVELYSEDNDYEPWNVNPWRLKRFPPNFASKWKNPGTGFEELVIKRMPPEGIILLVDSWCDSSPCPYCISLNSKVVCG